MIYKHIQAVELGVMFGWHQDIAYIGQGITRVQSFCYMNADLIGKGLDKAGPYKGALYAHGE